MTECVNTSEMISETVLDIEAIINEVSRSFSIVVFQFKILDFVNHY